jgi:hypothetical protein
MNFAFSVTMPMDGFMPPSIPFCDRERKILDRITGFAE